MKKHDPEIVAAEDPIDIGAATGEEVHDLLDDQDAAAEKYAIAFLKKVVRIRGVRIERAAFLRQELRKLALSDSAIDAAVSQHPLGAGVSLAQIDKLATETIVFETRKSARMSFAAGIPGGFAMAAAIPADITQYYVHAFRIMQKLAYLYGWRDFLGELDDIDDETLGKLCLFLGVMMGVGGASSSLSQFASQVARPAVQKQIANQALTKTVWYGPMKQTLKLVGIKITKDSFAKGVSKAVPVVGGVVSGGMTLVALGGQAERLRVHLRQLPPPGFDAAEYSALAEAQEPEHNAQGWRGAADSASEAAGKVSDGAKDAARAFGSRAKGAMAAIRPAKNKDDGSDTSSADQRASRGAESDE